MVSRKPVITPAQLLLMSVGSALMYPYTFMPVLSAPPANQDAWIVLLMSLVYVVVLSLPLLFLMNKFRGFSVNETTELIFGKWAGKAAVLVFMLFFLFCYTACMLITAIFLHIYIFPHTPIWASMIFMVVPITYTTYKGAGAIGRIATFVTPLMFLSVVFFFLLALDQLDFSVFMPILADSKFLDLNLGAFLTAARYSEILIFFVFAYYLKKESSVNKTFAASLGTFGAVFMLMLIPTVAMLGIGFAKHAWNPYYVYTRQIEGYDFIERVQSLNMLAWFPTALLKLTIYNYMGSFILSGVFKTKTHRPFVIPLSATAFIICLLPFMQKSTTVEMLRSDQVFPFIILPVTFLLPIILVTVYAIRRKKINKKIRIRKKIEEAAEEQ